MKVFNINKTKQKELKRTVYSYNIKCIKLNIVNYVNKNE